MSTVTNISPQGDLELPLIGRVVAAGESVEVPADVAEKLAAQPDVWLVTSSTPKIADLRAAAEERGIDLTGLKKKADIEAALAAGGTGTDDDSNDDTEGGDL
ncbi:hypothetical protein [Herbiconiux sp. VKM Ac-2851]|uniref:hypothetical protein n=1 Tax=Herbiconiux sp. VKM Ac-2851 TaxID=2739025 RepID=UPI00156691C1|nr:hypothetical protein [Herbiconiux sp. VKM Ac-2851]NQX36252.1 hypothetical protein [Herbiconiux sp. VKM Ac-2851]